MSDTWLETAEPEVQHEVPAWWEGMEFCHVASFDSQVAYCGAELERIEGESLCLDNYDGEAICPGCGLPTCPRCAQLADLENRMEDA